MVFNTRSHHRLVGGDISLAAAGDTPALGFHAQRFQACNGFSRSSSTLDFLSIDTRNNSYLSSPPVCTARYSVHTHTSLLRLFGLLISGGGGWGNARGPPAVPELTGDQRRRPRESRRTTGPVIGVTGWAFRSKQRRALQAVWLLHPGWCSFTRTALFCR